MTRPQERTGAPPAILLRPPFNRLSPNWWIAIAVSMAAFSSVAFFNPVLGALTPPLRDQFGWSTASIGFAITIGTIAGAILTPAVGIILDRRGARELIVAGVAILAAMMLSLAFIDDVWQLWLAWGVGRAIAVAVIETAVIVVIANWFIRDRGRAMGLTMVGTRSAMALMPAAIGIALAAAGLREAFIALTLMILIIALLPPLIIRRRPEDIGLLPDSGRRPITRTEPANTPTTPQTDVTAPQTTISTSSSAAAEAPSIQQTAPAAPPTGSSASEMPRPVGSTTAANTPDNPEDLKKTAAEGADPEWTVRGAIRTRAFWLLLLGTSMLRIVGGTTNFMFVLLLTQNGIPLEPSVFLYPLWAGMGILGGIIGGELRQRMSVRRALPLIIIFTTTGIIWLMQADALWMAIAFVIWHGLAFGAQLPLNRVSFPDYFGRYSVGRIRSATAPIQLGLNALGPLAAGLAFDQWGNYDRVFLLFILLLATAALSILLAKPPDPATAR